MMIVPHVSVTTPTDFSSGLCWHATPHRCNIARIVTLVLHQLTNYKDNWVGDPSLSGSILGKELVY